MENIFKSLFGNLEEQHVNGLKTAQFVFAPISRFENTLKKLDALQHLLNIQKDARESEKETATQTMLQCAVYLFIFDLHAALLDIVVLLLILGGHDLYNPLRNKFVDTVETVGEVNLEIKFKFLRKHKLEMLVRPKDQRLRNKIAHNDFDLTNEKWIILIKKEKYNVGKQSAALLEFCMGLLCQLDEKGVDSSRSQHTRNPTERQSPQQQNGAVKR